MNITVVYDEPRFLSMRDKVNALETEMRKREQIDIPVKHHFSQGVYAREITIPAGDEADCVCPH